MKKLLKILLITLMSFTLFACGNKSDNQQANMSNPVVSYDSLDEINGKIGTHIVAPAIMGKSDERYSIISEKIASYDFKANGYDYTIRGSKAADEDISGIYIDGNPAFEGKDDQGVKSDSTCKVARYILGDYQYTITVKDEGAIDEETFDSICIEIGNQIISETTDSQVKSLVGEYTDSYSQRARGTIELVDVNTLLIDISWASSSSEEDEWISLGFVSDGKLNYQDMAHLRISYDENGEVASSEVVDTTSGYFEIKNGKLLWTGSNDENTSSCVFENISNYEQSSEETLSILGGYSDSYSQRAGATIELVGVNQVAIDVTWSSSASSYDQWTAIGNVSEGKITYEDMIHQTFTTDEEAKTVDTTSGYFEIKDGKLLWTGSNNENTSSCVFEKIVY